MSVRDKVVIVTGGAGGIGFETVKVFTDNGAKVVLADYAKLEGEMKVEQLKEAGKDVIFCQVNVAQEASVQKMVQSTLDHYGRIDVLINNAGITRDGLLVKMSVDNFQAVMDVNIKGVFLCTQAVIPTMLQQGKGVIINTSSVSGIYGNVGQTNYAASKAAVVGMTRTWAKELGPKGIRCNAVAPGFIATNMVATIPEKVIDKLKNQIPLKRLGVPEDIAKAYLYLASEDASYVNGSILHVDGGVIM